MSTHTPGPWIVFIGPTGFEVLPAGRSGRIAGPVDSADDADLIAAAPDMLAALKAAIAQADANLTRFDGRSPQCEETYGICKAAIAKAEGRS